MRRMRFTCWITEDTDTHSEYVAFLAFQQQQWLRERVSMLRVYVHCLSRFGLTSSSNAVPHRTDCNKNPPALHSTDSGFVSQYKPQ